MNSIQYRLLFWLLITALLGSAGAAALTYHNTLDEFNELFDYQLRQLTLSVSAQGANSFVPQQDEDNEELDFTLQMWTLDGTLLFRSYPEHAFSGALPAGFSTLSTLEDDLRVYTRVAKNHIIQAAQPLEARRHMAVDAALRILGPALGLIPILALLIIFSLRRGLAPIAQTARAVGERSAQTLQPLPIENLPRELKPLVIAINGLMERLDQSLSAQRRFTADAAHELRSPLTAVSLQMQLLEKAATEEARRAAIGELKRGIQRASLLVQQLLALARVEPDSPRQLRTDVDLCALAKSVVLDFSTQAETKYIDLGVQATKPVLLAGDSNSLRIMICNLIDNAIRYTPAGGRIDVVVTKDNNQAVLEVIDNGPGIPPAERQRVFDRFYRIPGDNSLGSGLGLAIAKTVADQYHGTISLTDAPRGGLQVTVSLPVSI